MGRKVTLDLQVDPSIIGGFIARIGDMLIDGSVRQNLDSLGKKPIRGGQVLRRLVITTRSTEMKFRGTGD